MYNEEPDETKWVFSRDIFKKKVPKDHLLYRIDQEIDLSFVNEMCKDMYSEDKGRPVKNFPDMMFRAEIIQHLYTLSDRELARAVADRITFMWFVGYDIDDKVFHWTAPGKFRIALGKEKHKEFFDRIVEQLIDKGLIGKNENQSTDATHIIGDVALLSSTGVIKQALKHLLKTVLRRAKILMPRIEEDIDVDYYIKRKGKKTKKQEEHKKEYKMTNEEKRKTLDRVAKDALMVVWILELAMERGELSLKPKYERQLLKAIDAVNSIFGDYLEEEPVNNDDDKEDGNDDGGPEPKAEAEERTEGQVKYKARKDKGKARIVSTVDPDVRWGAKSDDKKFAGYKAHSTMTDGGFITNIEATPGGVTDDKPAVPLAEHQKERHGIVPEKMRGDAAYGTIDNRKDFKELGIQLVAPEKTSNGKGGFPKDMFEFDEENGIMTCPAGMKTTVRYYNKGSRSNVYHFDKAQCGPCLIKEGCTKRAFRTVSIHEDYAIQEEAKEYNATEDYKEDTKMRAHIEPKQAEMKRFHGLKRAIYRGLERVNIQALYTAMVVNLKRMVTVLFSVSARSKALG